MKLSVQRQQILYLSGDVVYRTEFIFSGNQDHLFFELSINVV